MYSLEEALAPVKTVAVTGHTKPDGDCIGSCLATYNYIKTYHPEIEVTLYLEPIPNIFKFLTRSAEIRSDLAQVPPAELRFDLLIVQDCGDTGRISEAEKLIGASSRVLCIDHHISNTGFGDIRYIFPQASSTSELVFDLLPSERITKQIAECLYVGIVHDTGIFQYSCTSSKTMRTAGFLMDTGIDFSKIVDKTYMEKTFEQNQILARALEKSRLHLSGACISSIITDEDMKACHALPKHLEGVAAQLRSTKGVEAAVFFYPQADHTGQVKQGTYKISLRASSDAVNVAEIAASYGGGGHKRAAGASTALQPQACLASILEQVQRQLEAAGVSNVPAPPKSEYSK